MTREQLDLLMLFLAVAGGLLGLPLAVLQLIETTLDVREKWARRKKRPRAPR